MTPGVLKQLIYYYPARWLSMALPVSHIAALGRLLAAFEYATTRPSTRRRLQQNIARALDLPASSTQVKSISRQVVLNYVWDQLEFGIANRLRDSNPAQFLQIVGFEPVQKALDRGFGVVIAGGHLATFELIAAAFAWNGFQTGLIVPGETRRDRVSGLGRKLVARFRGQCQKEHLAYSSIYTGGALQQAVDMVDQGGIVVMGVDYAPAAEARTCSFLAQSQPVPSGAARIAIEGQAALFLARLERIQFGQNRLTLTPVNVIRSSDPDADVLRVARTLAEGYESYVRANPAQWAWLMWQHLNR